MKSDLRMSADPEGEWEEEDGRPRRGVGRRGDVKPFLRVSGRG